MGSDSSDCVSLGEIVGLCLFAGCDSSGGDNILFTRSQAKSLGNKDIEIVKRVSVCMKRGLRPML
jgi:hypothetical protein